MIPVLWGMAALTVWKLPKNRPVGKSNILSAILIVAAAMGFFQVFVSVFGGIFFYGFGNSPYVFTPKGISENLLYVGMGLIGMELTRAWLLNHKHIAKYNTSFKLTLVALLYTFVSIPLGQITDVSTDLDSIQFINATLLPALAESLLASYFAFIGGPLPAIIYRGILLGFHWFSPILPDPEWMVEGFIGTLVPIAGLVLLERIYAAQKSRTIRSIRTVSKRKGFPYGWVATGVVVLLLALFSVGAFGVNPTVIISGSMQPSIDVGDIALVRDVSPDSIKEDDIIKFKEGDGTPVLHRVINVTEQNGIRVFQTKGDDNDDPDRALVYPEQVEGKVILTIPKLGWVSIGIKEMLAQ